MLNEFYNYIASNTLSFFQAKSSIMQPGERYCLKLDNEEMVAGVDCALRKITEVNDIQVNLITRWYIQHLQLNYPIHLRL